MSKYANWFPLQLGRDLAEAVKYKVVCPYGAEDNTAAYLHSLAVGCSEYITRAHGLASDHVLA